MVFQKNSNTNIEFPKTWIKWNTLLAFFTNCKPWNNRNQSYFQNEKFLCIKSLQIKVEFLIISFVLSLKEWITQGLDMFLDDWKNADLLKTHRSSLFLGAAITAAYEKTTRGTRFALEQKNNRDKWSKVENELNSLEAYNISSSSNFDNDRALSWFR